MAEEQPGAFGLGLALAPGVFEKPLAIDEIAGKRAVDGKEGIFRCQQICISPERDTTGHQRDMMLQSEIRREPDAESFFRQHVTEVAIREVEPEIGIVAADSRKGFQPKKKPGIHKHQFSAFFSVEIGGGIDRSSSTGGALG